MNYALPDTDENGDTLEVWLVRRSYGLLAPVCRMGCLVLLPLLLIADPLFSLLRLWPDTVPHRFLLGFHAATLLFLAGMYGYTRARQPDQRSHQQRKTALAVFIVTCLALSVWFGIVSWLGFGDLSMVEVTCLMIAAAFPYPGNLRRWGYTVQATLMAAGIVALDRSGNFLGQLQFVNVLAALAVTLAIDGFMMRNARELFRQKCAIVGARQRADEILFNALPHDIAQELKEHDHVQPQAHPMMAVLFADIVGFTALASHLPAAEVVRLLERLFFLLDAEVDRCQVEKIKTMGDAYMVVHATDADAVARFALALPGCVAQVNQELGLHLAMRIGMHCGPTVAGVLGTRRYMYDVWGDAVNLASRMESSGVPGRIHVSDAVLRQLRARYVFQDRGVQQLPGIGPTPTHFLLGARGQAIDPAC